VLSALRGLAANAAVAALIAATVLPSGAQQAASAKGEDQSWQAVAPGLVEPRSGQIRIAAPIIGRISDVLVRATDKVFAGELLIGLDDREAQARVATAQAQVAMRRRLRNDVAAGKGADRRKAEDAVAEAETALIETRDSFDKAATARRAGEASEADVAAARTTWTGAVDALQQRQEQLRHLQAQSGTPLPTEAEGELNVARSELWLANVELEKLKLRAPIAGTALQVKAKIGELAGPSASEPLVVLGDLSALRVRAELDQRDIGEVKLGQQVVVRADAFRGREFAGKVVTIAPIVQPGRISSPESRNLTDFDVTEVTIDLADNGPLLVGMKVDVYFRREGATQ